jgi:HAD superfamily hydrolase (TIGR01509 family)
MSASGAASPAYHYVRAVSAIRLVIVDVGGTLLRLAGPGLASRVLATISDEAERQRVSTMLLTRTLSSTELAALAPAQRVAGEPTVELGSEVATALETLLCRCAVVTLSNTTAQDATGVDPFAERFPHLRRYRSFEIGYAKPDERAFLSVLNAEGVAAHDAVHIGDSWTADVQGATSAGLRAVWVTSHSHLPQKKPRSLLGVVADFPAAVTLLQEKGLL